MQSLKGRRVAVTGATSGIGLALVKTLHSEGCILLAHGRDPEKLRAITEALPSVHTIVADVREPAFAKNFISSAVDQMGGCDVVVNNAGIVWAGPAERASSEKIAELVSTNVEAPFQLAHESIAYFKKQNSGHLVNITSVMGLKTRIYSGLYAGTKHALEALSDCLRQEIARTPVQITCIEPGMTLTGLHREFKEHPMVGMQVTTPLAAEDVVEAVVFAMTRPPHATVANLVLLPRDQKT